MQGGAGGGRGEEVKENGQPENGQPGSIHCLNKY